MSERMMYIIYLLKVVHHFQQLKFNIFFRTEIRIQWNVYLFCLIFVVYILKNYYIHFYKVISFNGHFGGYETHINGSWTHRMILLKNIKNHESLLSG